MPIIIYPLIPPTPLLDLHYAIYFYAFNAFTFDDAGDAFHVRLRRFMGGFWMTFPVRYRLPPLDRSYHRSSLNEVLPPSLVWFYTTLRRRG